MADDTSKTGAADRTQINVNQPHEVQYWTKALGISEDQLKTAVKSVGPNAEAVRKHLGKSTH
jgi:hypothetical protein